MRGKLLISERNHSNGRKGCVALKCCVSLFPRMHLPSGIFPLIGNTTEEFYLHIVVSNKNSNVIFKVLKWLRCCLDVGAKQSLIL